MKQINLTYGRFNQIHNGHLEVFNTVMHHGNPDEAIIASNRIDFGMLRDLLPDASYTSIRTNNVFSLVSEIIELYGEDVRITFIVGEDQEKFANALQNSFPQVETFLIPRSPEAPSSTRVRELFASTSNKRQFVTQTIQGGCFSNEHHAKMIFNQLSHLT